MDPGEFRSSFPVLDELCWLASPSSAPGAVQVIAAMHGAVDAWARGEVSWPHRDEDAQRTRHQFAALIGVDASDVALVQSVAEAAATVEAAIRPPGRIVVGDDEYRSNLFPWLKARDRGVVVERVPMPDGALYSAALVDVIDESVSLVAVSDVQSATGFRTDLRAVAGRCDEVGARLFVDATQSAGVLRLPEGVRPDFVAVHGYKWLLCPRGAAWLFVRRDRLEELTPLAPSPKSTAQPWTQFYGGPADFAPDARRLDLSLCWPTWTGAAAALDLVSALDPDVVEQHAVGLADLMRAGAEERGLRCLPSECPSHILGIVSSDAEVALKQLNARGVRATARAGVLRFGFHAFNQIADVECALDALEETARAGQ